MRESIRPPEPPDELPASPANSPEFGHQHDTVRQQLADSLRHEPRAYTPHPLDNPKVGVKKLPHLGRAVFAQEAVRAGEVIAAFVGQVHRAKKISDLPNDPPDELRDHCIQVSAETYLHGKSGLAELINHSCDPNCGIQGKSMIVARRDIAAGEQLTWDYAMTEDSDWSFPGCLCGSAQCRGTIGPYRDLPDDVKRQYWPHTSSWLREKYPQFKPAEAPEKNYRVETISSASEAMTDELLWEVTWFFWWLFANDFAGQFLFYPSEQKPISAQQAFGLIDDSYVPFDRLREYSPADFPRHPATGEAAQYWVDPQTTFSRFKEKFANTGAITLLRDEAEHIAGFTFGRKCRVHEAFEGEEWENPVAYAAPHQHPVKRDLTHFVAAINDALASHPELVEGGQRPAQLTPDSEVYVWNCIGIAKTAHGKGLFWRLTSEFFRHITAEDQGQLWNLAEAVVGNTAFKLFKRARTVEVPTALGGPAQLREGDSTMIITPLEDFVRIFQRRQ